MGKVGMFLPLADGRMRSRILNSLRVCSWCARLGSIITWCLDRRHVVQGLSEKKDLMQALLVIGWERNAGRDYLYNFLMQSLPTH